ncbi:MAG: SLBB domain-containing protein [Candidatus Binataceae bacterium]|nr:SLBB domain-containing protein [Candidatus Binataceae bacterium]
MAIGLGLCLANVAAAQMSGFPGTSSNGFGAGAASGQAAGMTGAPIGQGIGAGMSGMGSMSLSPDQMAAIAQRLGMSVGDLSALRSEAANGGLSADQIQRLCLRLSAKGLGPQEIEAMAGGLGLNLSGTQLAALKSCTAFGQAPQATPSAGMMPPSAQSNGQFPQAAATPSGPSSIEQTFQALDSGLPPTVPSPKTLTQFGYGVFTQPVTTFAPTDVFPVGNDYVIGPDDELRVLLWGRVNDNLDLFVDRDGTILVPEFGPLQVAGLTFAQARQLIEDRGKQITGVKTDVTMGRLRTIQVFVIGEVNQPGPYTVSALSRVSNALVAAGGIAKSGSLRRIQVRRGNQLVRTVDLYSLLLNGNDAGDMRLESQDVLFVPVIGPVAAVAGDVKRPAIYEITGRTSLRGMLQLAGGITAFGYSQRLQVERVMNHDQRVILDVDLKEEKARTVAAEDGDLIKVYTVLPQQTNTVTVDGNVSRPGKYQYRAGMRLTDLINLAQGVQARTYFRYALLRRTHGPQKNVQLLPINLDDAMSGASGSTMNLALAPGDDLTVFSESQIRDLPTVQVQGEVRNPGYYVLDHQMKISDLIYMAGGLKDDAYQGSAELARTQVIDGIRTSHTYMDVDLRDALGGIDAQNPVLMPNDQLFVRKASDWHLPWVVEVRGEVRRPGPYAVHKGERLAELMQRCGGLLPDAYPPATVFFRQSIKIVQQQAIDQARAQLEQQVAQLELMPQQGGGDSSGGSGGGSSAKALLTMQKVLSDNQNQQALGRLVIHLGPIDQLARGSDNITLEDGDIIAVPGRPSSINVLGQVYTPNAIIWQQHLRVRDYLQMAGGPTEGADALHTFVIRSDGSVLTDQGLRNSEKSRMFPLLPMVSKASLMDSELAPGDTVYVPEQLVYFDKTAYAKDITSIIANSAMSLGVLGLLGTGL